MRELPAGWAWAMLGEVAEVRLGRQRSPKNHSGDHMRRYLRAANVGWGELRLEDIKAMNFTDTEVLDFRLRCDDILVVEASGSPSEVGKSAIWSDELTECCFQNTLIRVRPMEINARYAASFLEYEARRGAFVEQAKGVGIAHIGSSRLASWKIPIAPGEEQERIVESLHDQNQGVERGRATLDRAFLRILSVRASLLADTVGASPASAVPDGWHWRSVGDLSYASGYGTSTKCSYTGGGRPVLRIPNIRNGVVDASDLKFATDADLRLAQYYLNPGDLLIVRTNGSASLIGRTALARESHTAAFASYLIRFRFRDVNVARWVQLVLESPLWRRKIMDAAASSAGQFNLNLKFLGGLPIPLPPEQEVRSRLKRAGDLLADLDSAQDIARGVSKRPASLSRSLLHSAFTGDLVAQDRSTESAEIHLSRLRARRAAALSGRVGRTVTTS